VFEVLHRDSTGAPALAKRFERNVESDLVPKLEAVRHGLRQAIDADGHAFDDVRLGSLAKRRAGKTGDPQADLVEAGTPRFVVKGEPDLVGTLSGEVVKAERGKEADDAVGDAFADLGERVVLGDVRPGGAIQSTAGPFDRKSIRTSARRPR